MRFLYRGPSHECARRMVAISAAYDIDCDVFQYRVNMAGRNGFVNRRSRVRLPFPAQFFNQFKPFIPLSGVEYHRKQRGKFSRIASKHSIFIADLNSLVRHTLAGLFYCRCAEPAGRPDRPRCEAPAQRLLFREDKMKGPVFPHLICIGGWVIIAIIALFFICFR